MQRYYTKFIPNIKGVNVKKSYILDNIGVSMKYWTQKSWSCKLKKKKVIVISGYGKIENEAIENLRIWKGVTETWRG